MRETTQLPSSYLPGGSAVRNLPAKWETQVPSLGRKDPLEKEMATLSNILAWEISLTEDLAGYRLWGCKELDTTYRLNNALAGQG